MSRRRDGWIAEQMGGPGEERRGNVSRSRPSTDDKRAPLQLSKVDPHLCAVARLPHPDLKGRNTQSGSVSAHSFGHKKQCSQSKDKLLFSHFEGGKDELYFLAIVINLVVFSLSFDFCCSRENYCALHKQHFLKGKKKDMSGFSPVISRQNPPLE